MSCLGGNFTSISDDDSGGWPAGATAKVLNPLDDVHSLENLAEDDVLAIEPWAWNCGDEELAAVGVWTSVGHGEETWAGVLDLEALISELNAVDGLTTSAILTSEITTLDHEVWNNAVEWGSNIGKLLAGLTHSLFASAKSAEVLDSPTSFSNLR